MKKPYVFCSLFIIPYFLLWGQPKKTYHIHTLGFYNLENLFDTINNPNTFDDDRTPDGADHWTKKRYQNKLKNLSKVIADIGIDQAKNTPVLLGVAEVENLSVLEELIAQPALAEKTYRIIHYDSPDKRGIDVGLLYQSHHFKPTHSLSYELLLYEHTDPSKRVYTRDQLVVSGYLDGSLIYLIVNHWPSRRGGKEKSSYKRKQAALLNKRITDSIYGIDPYAKIITMGDFNDDPDDDSIKKVLGAVSSPDKAPPKTFYNPMEQLAAKGIGSLAYRDHWNLFDQILVSPSLSRPSDEGLFLYKAAVFIKPYLLVQEGAYKGYPYRTYSGGVYTGGYSDHYPVYIHLLYPVKE
ncbi:endonuclease/exonuclease/phosphatase family protein [Aquimarina sp. TRL1]|uniref:endonuclease/exonuclease/phosphatase family protein n=1 Tax=Aquimarina sp. (strain TRL1) TaxID=2736252 RepID=UPI00158E488B|nr:endonuclease/exonuclease/phosphatase family protein [Aquimarina sp. TRL1]QKX04631.1 endonuclease/exonuclease/phosphatase family protein [Aquimarina sp. TRL1]